MGTQSGWEPGCRAAGGWSKLSSALLAVVWALGDYFQLLLTHLRNVFPSPSLVLGCLVLSLIPASKGHEGFSRWWQSSSAGSGAAEGPRSHLVLLSSHGTISIVPSRSLVCHVGNPEKPRGASAEPPRKNGARSHVGKVPASTGLHGNGSLEPFCCWVPAYGSACRLKRTWYQLELNWASQRLKAGKCWSIPQELIRPHPRLFHPFPASKISPAFHCSWAQPSPRNKKGEKQTPESSSCSCKSCGLQPGSARSAMASHEVY